MRPPNHQVYLENSIFKESDVMVSFESVSGGMVSFEMLNIKLARKDR